MSHIKKVVETLGGWKPALKMVKPSTSTFAMIVVLIVLVIFFPENQWGWEDGQPSSPPKETQSTANEIETIESVTTEPLPSHTTEVVPSDTKVTETNPPREPMTPVENPPMQPAPESKPGVRNEDSRPPVIVTVTQYSTPVSPGTDIRQPRPNNPMPNGAETVTTTNAETNPLNNREIESQVQ